MGIIHLFLESFPLQIPSKLYQAILIYLLGKTSISVWSQFQ